MSASFGKRYPAQWVRSGSKVGLSVNQTSIERNFPVNELSALARKERPDLSRPPLYLHKWWARRFGSFFRYITLPMSLLQDNGQERQ